MSELEVRFIRHAKGSHMLNPDLIMGRSIDAVLVDEGKIQADLKGKELAARGIIPDYVASSSALRCIQTGKRILAAMNHSRALDEITDDLLEMDQGNFVGRKRAEVYDRAVQQQILERGKDFALPGGESMNQVGKRGLNWLRRQENLVAQGKLSVFAIAHVGLITHTVGAIENWDQAKSLAMMRTMPPVGETRIVFDGNEWHVDTFAQPIQDI
jgi:broad specificity phosphatase PhoE